MLGTPILALGTKNVWGWICPVFSNPELISYKLINWRAYDRSKKKYSLWLEISVGNHRYLFSIGGSSKLELFFSTPWSDLLGWSKSKRLASRLFGAYSVKKKSKHFSTTTTIGCSSMSLTPPQTTRSIVHAFLGRKLHKKNYSKNYLAPIFGATTTMTHFILSSMVNLSRNKTESQWQIPVDKLTTRAKSYTPSSLSGNVAGSRTKHL
jgi:hypothetical protein